MPTKSAVLSPSWGLYFDRPSLVIPPRGLHSGENFRVLRGSLSNLNLGWAPFSEEWTLNGPVMRIDNFFPRGLNEQLIFITLTDVYRYDEANDVVIFLTPVYVTGSAAASGTTVTGTGTSWDANVKAGDEISFGASDETDPDADWFVIDSVDSDTQLTLEATAGTVSDGDYTIRKLFTGSQNNDWNADVFVNDGTSGDDLWIATNGVDDIISWNGDDDQVTLHPELGFTATNLKTFSNMMIYMNIEDSGVTSPTDIINSDVGEPLLAGDVGTGLSEQFKVHGGQDEIRTAETLGDYLVIYSERHIVLVQFVGDPLVFIFRTAAEGRGTVAPRSIANFGDHHEFISLEGQFRFDGVSVTEINKHVWRDILRQIDPARRDRIFSHFDEENADLIWATPLAADADVGDTTGDIEKAYVEHYMEAGAEPDLVPHSKRAFPFTTTGYYERQAGVTWTNIEGTWEDYNFTWDDQFFTLAFPLNLAGNSAGEIHVLGEAQEGDGTALPSFVRFGRRPLGNGMDKNLLTRIYPFLREFDTDLSVNVWLSDHASKAGTAVSGFTFDQSLVEDGHFVSVFRAARYVDIGFSTTGTAWLLDGYDISIRKGGSR